MDDAKPADQPIYIVDELEAAPGCEAQLRDSYLEQYAPGARERGMRLQHCWRNAATPPGRTVTLIFVWSVANPGGWWQMRVLGHEEKVAFWSSIKPLLVRRNRRFFMNSAEVDA